MNQESTRSKIQQDATDAGLTIKQQQALDLLLQGQSITEVSRQVDVDRTTVYRWQNTVDFEAERNRRLQEIRDTAHARLAQMAEKSFAVVEDAIEHGDAKTALAVLKGLGYLCGIATPIGSSDADRLRHERTVAEKRQATDDLMARLSG